MSLIDLASLVLAPTATKEGKVYSAIPDTGEGDMTFTRGSAATRVNSEGLIEKERANLLLQSNQFDTTWSVVRATETQGATGYDGSNDAWTITPNATNDSHSISQASWSTSSGLFTVSIYAKANGYNYFTIRDSAASNNYGLFDLSQGTSRTSGTYAIDTTITAITDGWYRCQVVFNRTSGGSNNLVIYVNDTDTTIASYSGDGTSGIIFMDSQANQGLVAQSYIETTTSAVYEGITDDVPRVDYSGGGCPSLLLEPSRTNLFPQSEYLKDSTHWTVQNVSFSVNQGISPEGQNNAIKVVPNSTGAAYWLNDTTLTSGQPYVLSFYAKSNGWDYLQVTNSTGVGGSEKENFDIINGTSDGDYATGDAVIEEFGNGWYKIIVKGTANASTGRMVIALSSGLTMTRLGGVTPSGDDGVLLYGFQWEQGSYSTSYIPTYSVSSTCVADSCSKTGISELIGQTEGTMFVDAKVTLNGRLLLIGAAGNFIETLINSSGKVNAFVRTSVTEADILSTSTYSTGDTLKIAFAYKQNDFALYVNGTAQGTDTSGNVPTNMSQLIINDYLSAGYNSSNGYTQAILFPTRLTNDQLEELTK